LFGTVCHQGRGKFPLPVHDTLTLQPATTRAHVRTHMHAHTHTLDPTRHAHTRTYTLDPPRHSHTRTYTLDPPRHTRTRAGTQAPMLSRCGLVDVEAPPVPPNGNKQLLRCFLQPGPQGLAPLRSLHQAIQASRVMPVTDAARLCFGFYVPPRKQGSVASTKQGSATSTPAAQPAEDTKQSAKDTKQPAEDSNQPAEDRKQPAEDRKSDSQSTPGQQQQQQLQSIPGQQQQLSRPSSIHPSQPAQVQPAAVKLACVHA
jgi:hypothetical protein